MELYSDFVVERFDQKPPPYSASYSTTHSSPVDSASPAADDVITGEKIAKLLSKVKEVLCDVWSLLMTMSFGISGTLCL